MLAQTTFDAERLRVPATWLHGPDARLALPLQYAADARGFEQQLAPGTEFDGELCFYPGAYPLRAQIRRQDKVRPLAHIGAAPSDLDIPFDTHANVLAARPFLERLPVLLAGLIPTANWAAAPTSIGHWQLPGTGDAAARDDLRADQRFL